MNRCTLVKVRWKHAPKWKYGVWYGNINWPSHSFWLVPYTIGFL